MMYILPFIRLPQRAPSFHQIWLFLERNGTHLIELDVSENAVDQAKSFAEENGLILDTEPTVVSDIVYCSVKSSPELGNFFTWQETPAGTTPPREVWRSFLWASLEGTDPWNLNSLMESIQLSDSHSVYSVLSGLDLKD
jgi:hypothetical protein